MRTSRFLLIATLLCSPAAFANGRSIVSVNGIDTNPCTIDLPCRSFSTAIAVTDRFGEVIAIDTGGFGPFSVDREMAVAGAPGVHAGVNVSAGSGVVVNTNNFSTLDRIVLKNLVVIGSGGSVGIQRIAAGHLALLGCEVRGFTSAGISSVDFDGEMTIDHCRILDNAGGYGVQVDGNANTNAVTITSSDIQGNAIGVSVGDHTNAAVVGSVISNNASVGIEANNNGATASIAGLMIDSCVIDHNTTGVISNASQGNSAIVAISKNDIAFNDTGASLIASGIITSFGNNRFLGNGSDGGPFTSTVSH